MKIDSTDRKILSILQDNSRVTTKEMASQLHLSNTPVYERVKKLEKAGIIEKYTAKLDPDKVGRSMTSFIMVSLQNHTKKVVEAFQQEAMGLPEVMEFYYISGNYDALLKVMVTDMREFKEFLEEKLASVENITQFHSIFVISGDTKDGFDMVER